MKEVTRRSVLQTAGVAGLAGVAAGISQAAESGEAGKDSFKTRIGKPKVLTPKLAELAGLPATNISPDGLAITTSFDKGLQLGLSEGGDLAATLVASGLIPVSAQEPSSAASSPRTRRGGWCCPWTSERRMMSRSSPMGRLPPTTSCARVSAIPSGNCPARNPTEAPKRCRSRRHPISR